MPNTRLAKQPNHDSSSEAKLGYEKRIINCVAVQKRRDTLFGGEKILILDRKLN